MWCAADVENTFIAFIASVALLVLGLKFLVTMGHFIFC